jgi:hypothetical protein
MHAVGQPYNINRLPENARCRRGVPLRMFSCTVCCMKHDGAVVPHQKVALFENSAYSFCMSREIYISASALPGILLAGLLLPFFLLR